MFEERYQHLKTCPICDETLHEAPVLLAGSGRTRFRCSNCETYEVSELVDLTEASKNQQKAAILSHAVRKMNRSGTPFLSSHLFTQILASSSLPRVSEQCNTLVLWLGEELPAGGMGVWVAGKTHRALIGASTNQGFELILDYLIAEGFIKPGPKDDGKRYHAVLSVKGWERFETLRRETPNSRVAFLAMKFGDPTLERIAAEVFKPTVEMTGFELRDLRDRPRAGLIDDRMRVEIRNARFMIADLSHDNPGAYWEAGFAEGLGKPVIYTCESTRFHDPKLKPHFDTNHHLTVVWDANDLAKAATELKATIRATLPADAKMTD